MREAIYAALCAIAGALLTTAAGANAVLGPMQLFPFLGLILRELSLSGAGGNFAAWAIYAVLCALPLAGLLPVKRKRGAADILFAGASVYSLWMWRMLANPGRMMPNYISGMEEIFGLMAGGVLVGLIVGGMVLRLAAERETRQMVRIAEKTVTVFAAVAGYGLGMGCTSLIMGTQSPADMGWGIFQGVCALAQTAALVWTLGGTSDLLNSVQWGWFDEVNASLADALAARSKRLLIVTVFASLLSNAAALALAGSVTNSSVSLNVPVMELIAALCCMLLARFIREGVRIKAENDEFV